ncbi:MAG: radical SAM family heme chaperone HemW [Nitrospirae bacterium]|nr:radical SAM family heme chaperone HemW [Nitrospirota bacterium]
MVGSLYIHIPFCLRKCPYCDFFSIPYDKDIEGRYIDALMRELMLRKDAIGTINTIFIGGGTPTVFDASSISRLLEFIVNNFGIDSDAEITLEANPSSVDGEKLRVLRDSGVNRISVGVQSFDDAELQSLGRLHNSATAVKALSIIKRYFANFSLDLIYGLEGQVVKGWIKTVRTAISFSPPHISAYELTPEAGTPLGRRVSRGETVIPHEDAIAIMYGAAAEMFANAGLNHYEISNFAAPGFQCRHNQNYWRRGLYAGIGAGAHSHLNMHGGTVRSSNASDLTQYLTAIENNSLPVHETTIINTLEALKEYVFLGLRTSDGISLKEAGIDSPGLTKLIENGLAEFNGAKFRLTRDGFLVSNMIIGQIIDQL